MGLEAGILQEINLKKPRELIFWSDYTNQHNLIAGTTIANIRKIW